MGLDTLGSFSAIFYKGDYLCDCVGMSVHKDTSVKGLL